MPELYTGDVPALQSEAVAPVVTILKLLAPYFAVGIFWCGLENAWLALVAYHVQILAWSWRRIPMVARGRHPRAALLWGVLFALAGPVVYLLLPHITTTGLGTWCARYGITDANWIWMIPYFGILHPILEEAHWEDLRSRTPIAHPCFAAYHVLVLLTLFPYPWLAATFLMLSAVSMFWHHVTRRYRGSFVPIVTHVLADLGIVVAAWLRVHSR